jgi:hypothetical protein
MTLLRFNGCQVHTVNPHAAACGKNRVEKAAEIGQKRRFARAGGSHHRQRFAAFHPGADRNQFAAVKRDAHALQHQSLIVCHVVHHHTRKPRRLRNIKPGSPIAMAKAKNGSSVCMKA